MRLDGGGGADAAGVVGDWTLIEGVAHRVGALVLVIAAGGAAYVVSMLALGLRPRHLRH